MSPRSVSAQVLRCFWGVNRVRGQTGSSFNRASFGRWTCSFHSMVSLCDAVGMLFFGPQMLLVMEITGRLWLHGISASHDWCLWLTLGIFLRLCNMVFLHGLLRQQELDVVSGADNEQFGYLSFSDIFLIALLELFIWASVNLKKYVATYAWVCSLLHPLKSQTGLWRCGPATAEEDVVYYAMWHTPVWRHSGREPMPFSCWFRWGVLAVHKFFAETSLRIPLCRSARDWPRF